MDENLQNNLFNLQEIIQDSILNVIERILSKLFYFYKIYK
jgi:hypothetical protein